MSLIQPCLQSLIEGVKERRQLTRHLAVWAPVAHLARICTQELPVLACRSVLGRDNQAHFFQHPVQHHSDSH